MSAERDHDWASVVVYATIPQDFEEQIGGFFARQTRRALEIALDRADDIENPQERESALDNVMGYLDLWEMRLPAGTDFNDRARRVEFYGIKGAMLKRIALREYSDVTTEDSRQTAKQNGDEILGKSLASYRRAMEEWATDKDKYHWVATQALSLNAVLAQTADPVSFDMAYRFAERDLSSLNPESRAWAHGTLAELELIRSFHKKSEDRDNAAAKKRIEEHCTKLLDLRGPRSFEVASTRRQFERYVNFWIEFKELAEVAIKILPLPEDATSLPSYPKGRK
jgi:hypothetical protein